MLMKIYDSSTSYEYDTSSDSDTSGSESEVEESDTPPSRSSLYVSILYEINLYFWGINFNWYCMDIYPVVYL